MLAPNNSSSWSNQSLIYVGDFGASQNACFLDLLIGLQIRLGLIAFSSTCLISFLHFLVLLLPQGSLSSHFVQKIHRDLFLFAWLMAFADLNACTYRRARVHLYMSHADTL